MGTIKSAFEIAMENTKSIEANKELVEVTKLKDEGKKLVSRLFDEASFNLKETLAAFDKSKLQSVREGLIQSLLANLVLPFDEFALQRSRKIGEAVGAIVSDTKRISMMFSQLEHFFKEFMDERTRLIETLERQYAPRLQKKEEEVSKQLGRPVKINPASDPEFQGLMRQYLGQLEAKYEEVLSGAKEEIKGTFLKG
jgi:polyhydroxyalkanoate synthesis regulator phasin